MSVAYISVLHKAQLQRRLQVTPFTAAVALGAAGVDDTQAPVSLCMAHQPHPGVPGTQHSVLDAQGLSVNARAKKHARTRHNDGFVA